MTAARERSDAVLAEDVEAVADLLESLGAGESSATLAEAARRLAASDYDTGDDR